MEDPVVDELRIVNQYAALIGLPAFTLNVARCAGVAPEERFSEWFGMDEIVHKLYEVTQRPDPDNQSAWRDATRRFVNVLRSKPLIIRSPINGWATLALMHGPKKVVDDLIASLATIQIVTGLVLSFAFPMVVNLPQALSDRPANSGMVIFFGIFIILTNALLMYILCMATSIELSLKNCARDCDVYRTIINIEVYPEVISLVLVIAFMTLTVAFAIAACPAQKDGLVAAGAIVGGLVICFVVLPSVNQFCEGNVNKWFENGYSNPAVQNHYDVRVPFYHIVRKALASDTYKTAEELFRTRETERRNLLLRNLG